MRPPELSSTQSRYCVASATAFQLKVGVAVAMLPEGATRVAAPGGAPLSMVNVSAPEVPPPGVDENTVTDAVPAVARSAAETAAVSCVALMNVVARKGRGAHDVRRRGAAVPADLGPGEEGGTGGGQGERGPAGSRAARGQRAEGRRGVPREVDEERERARRAAAGARREHPHRR